MDVTEIIEAMETELQEHSRESAKLKAQINGLLVRMGEKPRYSEENPAEAAVPGIRASLTTVRADHFFGKKLAPAVREYLELAGEARSVDDILNALRRGNFALKWKTDALAKKNLAISLSKNSKFFVKLPSGAFGLRAQYPN